MVWGKEERERRKSRKGYRIGRRGNKKKQKRSALLNCALKQGLRSPLARVACAFLFLKRSEAACTKVHLGLRRFPFWSQSPCIFQRDLSQIIATRTAKLTNQISDLDQKLSAMTAENRILKAKVEFSPDIPRPPEAQKTNGVLDQDLF